MAVVILGGLLTATILNLVVIPCVYMLVVNKIRPTKEVNLI
jgi:Cu/Ag efflux pump CusA